MNSLHDKLALHGLTVTLQEKLHQLRWPEKLAIYDLTSRLEDNLDDFNKFLNFLRQDLIISSATWATKMSFLYLLDSLLRNTTEESKLKEIYDTIYELFQTFGQLNEVRHKWGFVCAFFSFVYFHDLIIAFISQYQAAMYVDLNFW